MKIANNLQQWFVACMKMGITFVILLSGCANRAPQPSQVVPDRHSNLSNKGVLWISQQQLPDGSWGCDNSNGTRVLLTSLACMAFLSHGVAPANEEFGASLEKALRYLLSAPRVGSVAVPATLDPTSALTWTLGEAYAITRIPVIGGRVNELRDRVVAQSRFPSPFDLWAIQIVPTNLLYNTCRSFLASFRDAERTLLNQACVARATRDLNVSDSWWKSYDVEINTLVAKNPGNWRSAEFPMVTLVALTDVFAEANHSHLILWWKSLRANLLEAENSSGSWSHSSFAVADSEEASCFSNEQDRTFYTTCMTVIAMNQVRRFQRCRHGVSERGETEKVLTSEITE